MATPAAPPATPPPPAPPPPAPREAKWLPLIAVVVVILFVAFGGFLIAGDPGLAGEELAGGGAPGQPVMVADGVVVTPSPGWGLTEQFQDPPGARFNGGAGNLLVFVPQPAAPESLIQGYVEQVLEPEATQLTVSDLEPVPLPSGVTALRTSYIGRFEGVSAPLAGEVTALLSPAGTGVLFDGWAGETVFVGVRDDVRSMVEMAEVA